ncbi:branched-chain amino acid ABC transporter permease [Chloroflexota bacterium]
MEGSSLLQAIVSSLFLASFYVLVASGLALQFSILRVINFVHGQFYMLASFVTFFIFSSLGLNYFIALIAAMVVMALLGLILERFYYRIMGIQEMPAVIGAMGIAMIIERIMSIQMGNFPKPVPDVFDVIWRFGGAVLTGQRLLVIITAIVIMGSLMLFIWKTKIGKAMRAVSQDAEAASAQGINVNFIRLLAMGIGCAMAGAAGALMAPISQAFVYGGLEPMLKGFIIIIIGGLGSLGGAVIGGAILGLVDGFGIQFIGYPAHILGFVIVVVVLILKPQGILGRE